MTSSPKVSVLLPVYNTHPQHLRECIASILSQTFSDFEFLILNDSPENTELDAIVTSFDDPRIIYKKNERNLGISASRNKLLDAARGEYLAVMDHDDISLPQRFEKEVAYMDEHPEIGVCSCWVDSFPDGPEFHFPERDAEIKKLLMAGCAVKHPAAMIRKAVLTQHNIRYEDEYSPAEDYCLWLRLMEHTRFHNIQEVLFHYRWHADNTTHHQLHRMSAATHELQLWAHEKHPVLYDACWYERTKTVHIKLFKIIPFLKLIKRGNKTTLCLFNHIPIIEFTERRQKWPK